MSRHCAEHSEHISPLNPYSNTKRSEYHGLCFGDDRNEAQGGSGLTHSTQPESTRNTIPLAL